ncbi:LINE-1 reverse transcriptase-like protein [Elysia marginata]|uniref:LINE-1 reverse transcriptase-like protein n=1 Tax=Elysia marginata TaxID=1093978 RepID=A0AAV4JWC3_9GAST|nr:LINE-1 reverse transcriptase-like protein [Elysia marginata]
MPIYVEIKKEDLSHTFREPVSNVNRQLLNWNPQRRKKVCRPKQTWRRRVEAEVAAANIILTEHRRTRKTVFDGGVLSPSYLSQGIKR